MANTKLWNQGPDGFASEFSLGGLPVFSEDLQMMQNNSTELFGMLSLLKGWSCVVRGCYVDEINTANKTVKVTPGVVVINGRLYAFDGYEGQYPFSIIKGAEAVDTRIFKDGSVQDVAIEYATAVRTSFSFGTPGNSLESLMPTNLGNEEIYFDPFTGQRAETILKNQGITQFQIIPNYNTTVVSKTETGKSIVGGNLNWLTGAAEGRWKHFGWFNNILLDGGSLRQAGSIAAGQIAGSNNVILQKGNIPAHTHGAGSLFNVNSGEHTHSTNRSSTGNFSPIVSLQDTRFSTINTSSGSKEVAGSEGIRSAGNHSHDIQGNSGNGELDSNGNGQLRLSPNAVDVKGKSLYCNMMAWVGYDQYSSFYRFYDSSLALPISNM